MRCTENEFGVRGRVGEGVWTFSSIASKYSDAWCNGNSQSLFHISLEKVRIRTCQHVEVQKIPPCVLVDLFSSVICRVWQQVHKYKTNNRKHRTAAIIFMPHTAPCFRVFLAFHDSLHPLVQFFGAFAKS